MATKQLALAWTVSAVLVLTALPLLAVCAAEALDGFAGIQRAGWLLIFGCGFLIPAVVSGYLAWHRFWRKFLGLRETLEIHRAL